MNRQRGFTLIETIIASALMLIILGSIYMMVIFYGQQSDTEQARVRLQQESRFLLSILSTDLKNAGAVLTLANTGSFLSAAPQFNGVYPINNTAFPDGLIVAAGDPDAVTKMADTSGYTPNTDGPSFTVEDITVASGGAAWAVNDIGILIATDGFYVFRVAGISGLTITTRATAVYYSGLLATANYSDPETTKGNAVTYPLNAPVVRLASFGIYLVRQYHDGKLDRDVRELVKVSDCVGAADVLAAGSAAEVHVIADNIWDFQMVYRTYPNFPDTSGMITYFKVGGSSDHPGLLSDIRAKTLKEVEINLIAFTDEYAGQGEASYTVPEIGDRSGYSLPAGKYAYKRYDLAIEPRNYNIKL